MEETIIVKRRRSYSKGDLTKNNEKNLIMTDKKRIKDENFSILGPENYVILEDHNYKIAHLKMMLKHYKQRVSGTKRELTERLYNYLKNVTFDFITNFGFAKVIGLFKIFYPLEKKP